MTGDGAGVRVATGNGREDFLYGTYQVDARVDNTSGVVTAFYLRSDYWQETKDFSEIDYEFLNGRPGVPDGVWLNSYEKGISNGETLIRPSAYQRLLKSNPNDLASNRWTTYTIVWDSQGVRWLMNGTVVQARSNGQTLFWRDMNGVPKNRTFASPSRASHVTFSIWTSTGSSFGGFGGVLTPADRSKTFHGFFANHRRVVCT
jgi:beta-glucanase (GH16 family)